MAEYVEAVKKEAEDLRTDSVQKAPGRPVAPASERSIAKGKHWIFMGSGDFLNAINGRRMI